MTRGGDDLAAHLLEAFHEAGKVPRGSVTSPSNEDWAADLALAITGIRERQGHEALAAAVRDSVERVASCLDSVSIAATGMGWLGARIPSVERVLVELIGDAQREVLVTAYSITDGAHRLWAAIERSVATGVRIRLVVNDIDTQRSGAVTTLEQMARSYPHSFELYDFTPDEKGESGGLHAKIVVVDRMSAVVGSPNLSHHGLVAAHEMALVVRGPTAEAIGGAVDRLLRSPRVRQRR